MGTQLYTVTQRGLGAPDYSNTVSSAIERAGIRLLDNQTLKVFGRSLNIPDVDYPLVADTPLASLANTHMTDFETMVAMPTIVPVGYALTVIDIGSTLNQDAEIVGYMDGWSVNCIGATMGGRSDYHNHVSGLSTTWIDPTALAAHVFDIKLYNQSTSDLYGGVMVVCMLEAIGTPPLPITKVCECPSCHNLQTESRHAIIIVCTSCGFTYGVYDFSGLGRYPQDITAELKQKGITSPSVERSKKLEKGSLAETIKKSKAWKDYSMEVNVDRTYPKDDLSPGNDKDKDKDGKDKPDAVKDKDGKK